MFFLCVRFCAKISIFFRVRNTPWNDRIDHTATASFKFICIRVVSVSAHDGRVHTGRITGRSSTPIAPPCSQVTMLTSKNQREDIRHEDVVNVRRASMKKKTCFGQAGCAGVFGLFSLFLCIGNYYNVAYVKPWEYTVGNSHNIHFSKIRAPKDLYS